VLTFRYPCRPCRSDGAQVLHSGTGCPDGGAPQAVLTDCQSGKYRSFHSYARVDHKMGNQEAKPPDIRFGVEVRQRVEGLRSSKTGHRSHLNMDGL